MAEKLSRILKVLTALSLVLLSVLLVFWYLAKSPSLSALYLLKGAGTGLLVYLFMAYAIALFRQALNPEPKKRAGNILDEDELTRSK